MYVVYEGEGVGDGVGDGVGLGDGVDPVAPVIVMVPRDELKALGVVSAVPIMPKSQFV